MRWRRHTGATTHGAGRAPRAATLIDTGTNAVRCGNWTGHRFVKLGELTLVCSYCGLKRTGS